MSPRISVIVLLFIAVRIVTATCYSDTYYYYGMISNQFAIAEAAYHGHWFSEDKALSENVCRVARDGQRFVPVEKYGEYGNSGVYTTFPAQDLPGYGYLIAETSKLFSTHLTSRYAYITQVVTELLSLLLFVFCIERTFGQRTSLIAALLYILCCPFLWPIASLPMRDIFVLGIFACFFAAWYLFKERNDVAGYAGIVLLIGTASLLLWVRPSGYYYFFLVSPLGLFITNRTWVQRIAFVLIAVFLPLFIFNLQFKRFNKHYYGTENTDLVGRALWEGMGIVPDNKYGFKLDDAALVSWVKSQGYEVKYSSPEMNRVLGQYARKVIREDPGYYARTVLVRTKQILAGPIDVVLPNKTLSIKESGLSLKEFVRAHPYDFVQKILSKIYVFLFFYGSLFLLGLAFFKEREKRLDLLLLTSPFFYTLATQIPLHFEPRYLATGAWVLVLPIAWGINRIIEKREQKLCAA